jgi:hypothetical protein
LVVWQKGLALAKPQLRLARELQFGGDQETEGLFAEITALQKMLKSLRGKLTTNH